MSAAQLLRWAYFMSNPRKHHYLPQFYLRGFAPDRRSLFQIEKASLKNYPCQIKDIAAIRDYHEIDWDGVEDSNAMEKNLAELENHQAVQLSDILVEGLSFKKNRLEMIEILSFLRMRVPAMKQHIDRIHESAIRNSAKIMERSGKFPKPPAGFEDALKVDNIKFSIMNWKCLEVMFRMASDPFVLDLLYKMRVTIFRAPFGTRFLTSDQPVAMFHPTQGNGEYGAGLLTPGIEVSLPLSSRMLLRLDLELGADIEKLATSEEVQEFNRRSIVMAQDYVFTGENVDSAVKVVQSNFSKFAGFMCNEIDLGKEFLQIHKFQPVGPM